MEALSLVNPEILQLGALGLLGIFLGWYMYAQNKRDNREAERQKAEDERRAKADEFIHNLVERALDRLESGEKAYKDLSVEAVLATREATKALTEVRKESAQGFGELRKGQGKIIENQDQIKSAIFAPMGRGSQ